VISKRNGLPISADSDSELRKWKTDYCLLITDH
jgi:hypothetical protein